MWKQIKPLLFILSVALNLAFVGVWLVHISAGRGTCGAKPCEGACEAPCGAGACVPGDSQTVWCPLHRKLNVTAEQWKELEPRLRAFRAAAQEICERNGRQRADLLKMLSASEPDMATVESKQEEILAAQRQMQALVIEQLNNEKKILSKEQRQQFFDLLRNRSDCEQRGPMLVPGRGV